MIEQLFGSKTRVKLLQLFLSNPNRSFYVREITRKIDEQINSVRRELANLLSIGVITSDSANNRLYYEVNQDYQHYQALAMMFGGVKRTTKAPAKAKGAKSEPKATDVVAPVEHPLSKDMRAVGRVDLALLTGQFTRDELAGIDLLIVGDINQAKLNKFIEDLEKSENKELRYTVMPLDSYHYRVQINDRFINNVLNAKKQVIIDSQNLVTE